MRYLLAAIAAAHIVHSARVVPQQHHQWLRILEYPHHWRECRLRNTGNVDTLPANVAVQSVTNKYTNHNVCICYNKMMVGIAFYRYPDLGVGTPASSLSPASSCLQSPYSFTIDSPTPTTEEFFAYFNAPSTYMEKDFSQLTLSGTL